jgi:NAD(P)-dependent dehydrogenase (short-subunit alcohol dehydrogenase family)
VAWAKAGPSPPRQLLPTRSPINLSASGNRCQSSVSTFERIGARLPVGRGGKSEDITEAYLYLLKTGFNTGETIVVDGGALQAP